MGHTEQVRGPDLPFDLLSPGREILAISAMLLPMTPDGRPDLGSLTSLVARTLEAGLVPAVNMDTGYGNLLSAAERRSVIDAARSVTGPSMLVAGAWVDDEAGASYDEAAQLGAVAEVAARGAVPVVFPNFALASLDSEPPPGGRTPMDG